MPVATRLQEIPGVELQVIDSQFTSGLIGFIYGVLPGASAPGALTVRYIHVADASIPQPPTAMLSAVFFAGVFAWQWRRWR